MCHIIPGTGYGVTAYVIDTGIYPDNKYFEGRAQIAVDTLKGDVSFKQHTILFSI